MRRRNTFVLEYDSAPPTENEKYPPKGEVLYLTRSSATADGPRDALQVSVETLSDVAEMWEQVIQQIYYKSNERIRSITA